jgi:hypothetical protein
MIGFIGTSLQLQSIITAHTELILNDDRLMNLYEESDSFKCMNELPFITAKEPNRDHRPPRVPLLLFMNGLSQKPCFNSKATVWFLSVYNFQFSYSWNPCSVFSPWQRICQFISEKQPTSQYKFHTSEM